MCAMKYPFSLVDPVYCLVCDESFAANLMVLEKNCKL